jgi:hypothetical protein
MAADATFQQRIRAADYPVPEIVEAYGSCDGRHHVIEASAGAASLHEMAVAEAGPDGLLGERVPALAAAFSVALQRAQLASPVPAAHAGPTGGHVPRCRLERCSDVEFCERQRVRSLRVPATRNDSCCRLLSSGRPGRSR